MPVRPLVSVDHVFLVAKIGALLEMPFRFAVASTAGRSAVMSHGVLEKQSSKAVVQIDPGCKTNMNRDIEWMAVRLTATYTKTNFWRSHLLLKLNLATQFKTYLTSAMT